MPLSAAHPYWCHGAKHPWRILGIRQLWKSSTVVCVLLLHPWTSVASFRCGSICWLLGKCAESWFGGCPVLPGGCPVLPFLGGLSCPARRVLSCPSSCPRPRAAVTLPCCQDFVERTEFPIRETIWVIGSYDLCGAPPLCCSTRRRAPPLVALLCAAITCVALLRQTSLFEKYKSMQTCDLLLLFIPTCSVSALANSWLELVL